MNFFKKRLCGQKMNGARVEDTQKKESKVIVQINQLSVPLLGHHCSVVWHGPECGRMAGIPDLCLLISVRGALLPL